MPDNEDPSSSLYKTLVDNVRDVITLMDENGVINFQSPSFEKQFGYTADELIGTNIFELIHKEDVPIALEAIEKVIQVNGDYPPLILRFLHKDKTWKFIEVAGQLLKGEYSGFVLITRDITEQQEIMSALRLSEGSFQAAFNATSAISAITVPDTGKFLDVNKSWVESLGWSAEEAIGKTANELNIWGGTEERNRVISEFQDKGRLRQFKSALYTKSGERRVVLLDAEYLLVEDDSKMFISGIDITEWEHIEEQLRQSQKLESIGQLTGGIAHDFNNLLSVILGHAELASMDTRNKSEVADSLVAIQKSAQAGAKLIQQLLAFSRKQKLSPESFNLGERLRAMRPILTTTLGKEIDLRIDTDDEGWQCQLDPIQLESAVLNMVINSCDAMPNGGELAFLVKGTKLTQEQALIWEMQPGDYLQLDIKDTGAGMSPELIGRAFEPFFTTKQHSGGTGLGLSMVFGFTKQSGGHVSISSDPQGRGTTLSLLLPRSRVVNQSTREGKFVTIYEHQNKRVLLVEDNEEVRVLISMFLKSLKLEVSVAGCSEDVEQFEEQTFDLLVSDVMLPGGMKGPDIARELRYKHPKIAVLYMTGYEEGTLSPEDLEQDKVAFLQKPFSRKDFSNKIESLLRE
jgi:PAS domain S-box-containing protein